jgi:UDP-N-acetylmuramyl tripeptide synthase
MRSSGAASTSTQKHDDTQLEGFQDNQAEISYKNTSKRVTLQLKGIYNIQNATAAVATVRAVMNSELDETKMFTSLSKVQPAFGRGEDIVVNGQPVELVLVKNPSGFRLSLASFNPADTATMVAINDNYADGRDMSWLWDVDFASLSNEGVSAVTGMRAYDMALRLQYDEIEIGHVDTDIKSALKHFIANTQGIKKRIYCTYTAMLAIRKELSKIAEVERVL